jgi:cation diffusion facilitator family transporter
MKTNIGITADSLDTENMKKEASRDRIIVRTSIIGIAANVFLAVFKAVVGLITNSIAITLDAVNNISDAGSSLITIIGTKLAGKQPDRKHPWGYGRIEYLSAMVISVIVLYAGITSFIESVKKIINPEKPSYTTAALIIVAVGVAVKIVLGRFVKKTGEKVNSDSLINSGEDATLDSIISASTLVAAVIFMIWGVSLEAWLGAIISIVIIKSGLEMLRDTISNILGERVDADKVKAVRSVVTGFPEVFGVYDMIFHDYGPDRLNGSVHIEVPDTMTADKIDELIRNISNKVYAETGVLLTAVSVYSMNTKNEKAVEMQRDIAKTVMGHEHVIQMHGFYLNEPEKIIQFDVMIDFDEKDRIGLYREVVDEVQAKYPDYRIAVGLDTDFSLTE